MIARKSASRSPVLVTVVLIGCTAAAGFFLVVDLGGTVRGRLAWGNLIGFAWWVAPLCLYFSQNIRRPAGRMVWTVGAGVHTAILIVLLATLWRDESSTAAIGVGTLGAGMWIFYLVVVSIEWLLRRRTSGE